MEVPDREECLRILREENTPEDVVKHILAVTSLAQEIARCCGADMDLVLAGAMLHDIGRGVSHGIDHAVIGAGILRRRGLPEAVVRIVERHIGCGITAEEAVRLGLPARDYMPTTLEEKVVAHADNLIADTRRQTLEELLGKLRKKGLEEQARRCEALHRELSSLCGFDLDDLCR